MKKQCVHKTGPTGQGPRCKNNANEGYNVCWVHLNNSLASRSSSASSDLDQRSVSSNQKTMSSDWWGSPINTRPMPNKRVASRSSSISLMDLDPRSVSPNQKSNKRVASRSSSASSMDLDLSSELSNQKSNKRVRSLASRSSSASSDLDPRSESPNQKTVSSDWWGSPINTRPMPNKRVTSRSSSTSSDLDPRSVSPNQKTVSSDRRETSNMSSISEMDDASISFEDTERLFTLQEYKDNRKKLYKFIKNRLIDIGSCLKENVGLLVLPFSDTELDIKDIVFEERIGTESASGEIYRVYIGTENPPTITYFISKVMPVTPSNTNEISVMNQVSEFASCRNFVNFPLIYTHLRCDKPCSTRLCPNVITKSKKYYTVYSELANCGDIGTFLTDHNPSTEILESIVLQLMYTLYTFHQKIEHVHRDVHLGNILIHRVQPGGVFNYIVGDTNKIVKVPNHGYIVILWDFGWARSFKNIINGGHDFYTHWLEDYIRPLSILIKYGKRYQLPSNIQRWLKGNFKCIEQYSNANEDNEISMSDFILGFPFIKLNTKL